MSWRRTRAAAACGFVAAAAVLWILLLAIDPPPDPYRGKPPSPQVLARDSTLLRPFLSADEKWRLRAGAPSPHLVAAVLEHEDRWFFRHPGVNPLAIVRAAYTNLAAGRVVSGASTITMQLARIASPGRRSFAGKLAQAYRALQYESLYSKEEILAAYLDLAPYGGNIEGIEAASRIYFGKPASELSVGEVALLAVIPQAPARHHPIRRPEAARAARDRLIARLEARGRIDERTGREARSLPMPSTAMPMPFRAPHFAEHVVSNAPAPPSGAYVTTIEPAVQAFVESTIGDRVQDLRPLGIGQGAAVVLDWERSELVALAGSAGFSDASFQGQVNGALAPRSPGSTLKPFVYALAIDEGLITLDTMLEDVPTRLGAWHPENFDHEYRGAISAAEALCTSRNVPAVRLARELERSGQGLYRLLADAGVHSLTRPPEHYGLSLVLGGAEVSLLELTNLYATLARGGLHAQVLTLAGAGRPQPRPRLFSAAAASIVLEALTDVTRPELDAVWRSARGSVPVPWKTGTSFGHRDAWSVGIAGTFVVGVWLGNFDGVGAPGLVGLDAAAPVLFELLAGLPRTEPLWQRDAPEVAMREICAGSGQPRGPHCPHGREGKYIPGVSPAGTCDVHREILVDTSTGWAVCPRCLVKD
ncbi:MAG: penicillin-binding protein 1C, partial [bacterium]